jgi:carbon storage regulator
MLVLSRQRDQAIVINRDITVMVVEIRGDKVRLGIIADPKIPVHRQEVFDAIERERLSNHTPVNPSRADNSRAVMYADDGSIAGIINANFDIRSPAWMETLIARVAILDDAVSACLRQWHGSNPDPDDSAVLRQRLLGLRKQIGLTAQGAK